MLLFAEPGRFAFRSEIRLRVLKNLSERGTDEPYHYQFRISCLPPDKLFRDCGEIFVRILRLPCIRYQSSALRTDLLLVSVLVANKLLCYFKYAIFNQHINCISLFISARLLWLERCVGNKQFLSSSQHTFKSEFTARLCFEMSFSAHIFV